MIRYWRGLGGRGRIVSLAVFAPSAARAADPIKIGFSMSVTGGLAGGGKPSLRAMEIWGDDINAKGGLLGRRPVKLVYYDDQSSPANVPAIYTKLFDVDKVDLLVSAYATGQIAPAMPVAMEHNMVFMALFGTAVNDKFNYDKYFQILPNGKDTAVAPSKGWFEVAMTHESEAQDRGADRGRRRICAERDRRRAARGEASSGLKMVYDKAIRPRRSITRRSSARCRRPSRTSFMSPPIRPTPVGIVKAAHEAGAQDQDVRRRHDRPRLRADQSGARAAV